MEKPPEILERNHVLEKLREMQRSGIQNQEVLGLLNKFFEQGEAKVKDHRDSIMFNIERARLYRDAGFIQEATENYLAAYDQAGYLGDMELAGIIGAELDALSPS